MQRLEVNCAVRPLKWSLGVKWLLLDAVRQLQKMQQGAGRDTGKNREQWMHSRWASRSFNPLNAELNPICHLLALLGGATIVVVSRLRVNIPECQ